MKRAATTHAPQRWRHLPTVVEGIRYDGSSAAAEAIMAWAPGKFVLDDYGRLCTVTAEGLRYVHEGSVAMLDVEGLPYSVRPGIIAACYVEAAPDYRAPLTPDRLQEIRAQARRNTDPHALRWLLDQVIASHEALQA